MSNRSRRADTPDTMSVNDVADELRDANERLVLASLRQLESSEAAARELARFNAVLEALQEGVLIADGTRRIIMMNAGARRIMGVPANGTVTDVRSLELRNLDMSALADEARPFDRAFRGRRSPDAELILVRSDGEPRRVVVGSTFTRDGAQVALAVVVLRDVTERRVIEARLLQSERLAAVGTLAAGVAHEVNNPLSYVLSNLELVLDQVDSFGDHPSPAQLRELTSMLREAKHGAERIRGIVGGLKTFSRIDEERRAVIDLRPVLELATRMAENEIRHRARLVNVVGPMPLVEADEARLGQVFVNLLVNAAHSFVGPISEQNEVVVATSTDAQGRAVIEFRDNGAGISEAALPRIFDAFFTTKAIGEGTGLGLSICHNIITAMGGELHVSSVVGSGTAFRVSLPAAQHQPLPPAGPPPPGPAQTLRGNVLVIDDELRVGTVLRRILKDHDFTFVPRVDDALALLAAGRSFDIILSDVMMPEKGGAELFEEMSRSHPDLTPRIVFMSGGAFTPRAMAFLDRVPNERIAKPIDAKALRATVQRYVDAGIVRRPPAPDEQG